MKNQLEKKVRKFKNIKRKRLNEKTGKVLENTNKSVTKKKVKKNWE